MTLGLIGSALAAPAAALQLDLSLADPLRTAPPVIERGAVLPGGDALPACEGGREAAQPLALVGAVDLALCNHPQIKVAWAGIKVQAGALGEARAAYFPSLSVTANRLRTRTSQADSFMDSSTDSQGNTVNGTLGWRLFDFGGRDANRDAANHLLAAAMAHHDVALQKTLNAVIHSYFDAQSAQATLQAKERNERIARGTLDSTARRAARGVAARSDTLQAATALAKATLEKNRARGAYEKSLAVLAVAIGMPASTRIVLADDLQERDDPAGSMSEAKSLQEWLEVAQQAHPAIRAARAEWESSRQKVIATRSEGLPVMDLSVNYNRNGFPNQGVSPTRTRQATIGISVTLPLFDGFSRVYRIKGAQAQAEQRQAHLQDVEQNILLEVVKSHADAAGALDNLKAARDLFAAARESLDSSQRRYEGGAADIAEILGAQMALSDAQEERIRSVADWRSARLRLLANGGVMNRVAMERR